MFCSIEEATRLQVTKWLEPPGQDQLDQEMGAPCRDYPSDHFAQAFEVEFKKREIETK